MPSDHETTADETTNDPNAAGAPERDRDEHDKPSLRQLLHAATGDRDAEAKALADRAPGEVSERDAKIAVQRAHGDAGVAAPATDSELASPQDAATVHDDRGDGPG